MKSKLFSRIAALASMAFSSFKASVTATPTAESMLSGSNPKVWHSPKGTPGNIAYRESCRNRNQRKTRKAYRQLIAAGGA